MKRGTIKILAAAFALSLIPATDASATTDLGILTTWYAGVYQGSGDGYSWAHGDGLRVTISYADTRRNGYSVYAKANFYKLTQSCTWYRHCSSSWKSLGEQRASNTSTSNRATLTSLVRGTDVTRFGTYASEFAVCTDIPLRADPCQWSGIHQYR